MFRRQFLALAGLAGAGVVRASDTPKTCGYPPAFPANPMAKPPDATLHVSLPAGPPVTRPLWSRMSPWDQEQMARKLRQAYGKMAKRAPGDKRCLLYQAWQHAVSCGAKVDYPDVHTSPDFLPWHRAFLFVHEWMLQAELQDMSFRIPVWDWENDPKVPWAYQLLPGVQGPCYPPRLNRLPQVTCGMMRDWLLSGSFDEFIGGKAAGGVHAFVHANLGLTSYMSWPGTAAADPLFYAHHANVDRYWVYWWNHYKDKYPAHWSSNSFSFYGAEGQPVRIDMADLMDPTKLGYAYDPPDRDFLYDAHPVKATPTTDRPDDRSFVTFTDEAWNYVTAYIEQLLGVNSPSALIDLLAGASKDVFEWSRNFSQIASLDLPVYATAKLPHLQGGRYYLVELRDSGSDAHQIVGGFGVFMGDHGMEATVYPLLTLDWNALMLIARSRPQGVRLVFGPQNGDRRIDGTATPFPVTDFEIRLPLNPPSR
jgi:hypothetical protein